MNIEAIAVELLEALDCNQTIPTITSRLPAFDEAAAYQVSAEILRRRRRRGERPVGRKIGFTNRAIWPTYGVSAPVWAHVYDSTVTDQHEAAGVFSIGHLARPRIEPEIVLHFARSPGVTQDEAGLLSCIDWIALGYELVQCPFADWKFQAPDTIAAFGLHGALVVGARRPVAQLGDLAAKLRTFTVALAREGSVQARGGGGDVLDSPLLAAAHLLRVLQDQPLFGPIQAGELVTTGTLTAPQPIAPGQTWTTEASGIELYGPGLRT